MIDVPLADVEAEWLRRDLASFVQAAWHVLEPDTPLQWNWHLDAVCAHVEALLVDTPGTPQNLLLNVPPGTMKSLLVSVFAPAWQWLRVPSYRMLFASGSPGVVTRDSLKCRGLVKSDWYQSTFKPSWRISADQDEKQKFANTAGGFRQGLGAGSAVVGERADLLACDDPNDPKEIHSEAHRTAINERWWDATWHNRIASPERSKRVVIMQRLHEADLAGHLLSREAGQWAHLSLPMEWEPGACPQPTWLGWSDPRSTPGELLMPSRFPLEYLDQERVTLGSEGYAGQMQQRPQPAGGGTFKRHWWRRYDELPANLDEWGASLDCAFKGESTSDFVVLQVWARRGPNAYLVASYRRKVDVVGTVALVRQARAEWPQVTGWFVEDKANGPAILRLLRDEVPGLVAVDPGARAKEARARAVTPLVEAGNVWLPQDSTGSVVVFDRAPGELRARRTGAWVSDVRGPAVDQLLEECEAFPRGRHDDQVDALSQMLERWFGRLSAPPAGAQSRFRTPRQSAGDASRGM